MDDRLYKILGVSKKATADEIKKVYRKLAQKYHPDVNPDNKKSEERFKEVNSAFAVLSDPDKRKLYDEFGEESLSMGFNADKARAYRQYQSSGGGGGQSSDPFSIFSGFGFGDAMHDIFRGGAQSRGRRGQDLSTSMAVDLRDAVLGGEKRLVLDKPVRCEACDGRGMSGVMGQACAQCMGQGSMAKRSELKIKVPPGIRDGQEIRLAGQGAPGVGEGASGDLLVRVTINPHARIDRDGNDLTMEVPITLGEAMRGARIDIPTFHGKLKVTVPPGAQSGTKLRLRGKGVAGAGDLFVRLLVHVPPMTPETEKAIDVLEASYGGDVRRDLGDL